MKRRTFFKTIIGLPVLLSGIFPRAAFAALSPTPPQGEGPFYPVKKPVDANNDLLRKPAGTEGPKGIALHLSGRVLAKDTRALGDIRVEIWQADARGIYNHPRARGVEDFDPAFKGFGHTVTDIDGRYYFRCLVPTAYTGRPPHIHVKLFSGESELLTTQLYIKGHPDNQTKGFWMFNQPKSLQMDLRPSDPAQPAAGQKAVFNFVL